MPGDQGAWRAEPDAGLAADVGAYRLLVPAPGTPSGGSLRFLALRRAGGDGTRALVGSGTEPGLRAAVKTAARMADRLVEAPGMRPVLSGSRATARAEGVPCAS